MLLPPGHIVVGRRSLKFWLTYTQHFGTGIKHIMFYNDGERTIPTSSLRSILDACPNVKSIYVDQFFEEDGLQTLFRYTNVEYLAFEEPFTTEVDMISLFHLHIAARVGKNPCFLLPTCFAPHQTPVACAAAETLPRQH